MAVSTPPPPPDPLSTTTTTRNFAPIPRPPHPHQTSPFFSTTTNPHLPRLASNPNPNYLRLVPSATAATVSSATQIATGGASLHPVASSGRGFINRLVAISNPISNSNILPTRPVGFSSSSSSSSYPRPPFGCSQPDPGLSSGTGLDNRIHLQQAGVVGNSDAKGATVSAPFLQSQCKITLSPTPVSNFNSHKDLRERSKDDAFVTVHDRKVRASDNASLYALCLSWLKNGFSEERQLPNLDAVRSLPRPLPLSIQDNTSPTRMEESEKVEEDEGSVENLSQKELLQQYVKHAKSVRSRIREQRLRRIAPYKTRLALLLCPTVYSNLRNDSITGELK